MEDGAVEGIVRREERHAVETGTRGVAHHHEETCVLQVQIGIGIDKGEVAQLIACEVA